MKAKLLRIATLNVKGLNNIDKRQKTLTLLKTHNFDIIALQETNLFNTATKKLLKDQWQYDSIWTSKTAILAGNKKIKFQDTECRQGDRVISTCFLHENTAFHITNIYAPPNVMDRVTFFNNFSVSKKHSKINIIAGDFNTNLNPDINRISQANRQNDPSKNLLEDITKEYIDSAVFSAQNPFLTFFQNTSNGNQMATRLDYIFLDDDYSHLSWNTKTHYGNSDHLL